MATKEERASLLGTTGRGATPTKNLGVDTRYQTERSKKKKKEVTDRDFPEFLWGENDRLRHRSEGGEWRRSFQRFRSRRKETKSELNVPREGGAGTYHDQGTGGGENESISIQKTGTRE